MKNNTYTNGSKVNRNASNSGTATGRVVTPVHLYDTSAEGKMALLCIACPDNYETRDEQGRYVRLSQAVTFRTFVPDRFPERLEFLKSLRRDDVVRVTYSVRTNNYVNSEGRRVHDQTLRIEDAVLLQAAGQDLEPDAFVEEDGDLPF